jgi:carbon storage regulator
MLVLSRNRHQNVVIGDQIVVTVVDIRRGKVRLGISAPKELPVHRQEVFEAIERRGALQGTSRGASRCCLPTSAEEANQTDEPTDGMRPPWIARVYRLADLSAAFASATATLPRQVP